MKDGTSDWWLTDEHASLTRPGSRSLFASQLWHLGEDPKRKLVFLRRSAAEVQELHELVSDNQALLRLFEKRPARFCLLIDYRGAPTRNDPEFEAAMAPLREGVQRNFRKVALVLDSASGVLQVNRLSRLEKHPTRAAQSVEDALSFLLSDT